MKQVYLLGMVMLLTVAANAQSLFVGTYNIRQYNNDDIRVGNGWQRRCPVICDMINFEQPDIFGTQEAFTEQLDDMMRRLDTYSYIGAGREDGKSAGEHSAIFYRRDKIKLLDHGDFWLSPTPGVPGLGWDAACVRICSWGKFQTRKPKLTFYFFNLHMDHIGVVARRESAQLVLRKIKEIAGEHAPVILTGDFNVDQRDEIYTIFTRSGLLNDAYAVSRHRFAENGTFNDYRTTVKNDSRIDHIFVSPLFTVDCYGILTNTYWTEEDTTPAHSESGQSSVDVSFRCFLERTPSDHYPVFARLRCDK